MAEGNSEVELRNASPPPPKPFYKGYETDPDFPSLSLPTNFSYRPPSEEEVNAMKAYMTDRRTASLLSRYSEVKGKMLKEKLVNPGGKLVNPKGEDEYLDMTHRSFMETVEKPLTTFIDCLYYDGPPRHYHSSALFEINSILDMSSQIFLEGKPSPQLLAQVSVHLPRIAELIEKGRGNYVEEALKTLWEVARVSPFLDAERAAKEIILKESKKDTFEVPFSFLDKPQSFLREVMRGFFEKYGLPADEMFDWWDDAGEFGISNEKSKFYTFDYNMKALEALEKHEKGLARKLLDEFNIHNFGRWDPQVLIKQYEDRNKQGPVVSIFAARSDYNGSFFNFAKTSSNLLEQFADKNRFPSQPNLRIYEVERGGQIDRFYQKQYTLNGNRGECRAVIYIGHGEPNSIALNEKLGEMGMISIDSITTELAQRMKKYFYFDPEKVLVPLFILDSCSTAEGIGKQISDTGEVIVVSPKISSKIKSISAFQDEKGQFRADVTWHDEGVGVTHTPKSKP